MKTETLEGFRNALECFDSFCWRIMILSYVLLFGIIIGSKAFPKNLENRLDKMQDDVTDIRERWNSYGHVFERIGENCILIRQKLDGKSLCPHKEIVGETWFVLSAHDGYCNICRPDDGGYYNHEQGTYFSKEGWWSAMPCEDLHKARVKFGSEKCDICNKEGGAK